MKIGESFILRSVASFLFFVLNIFAVYLLLRGHNLPGGGFIGGLGSALSFILLSLAVGVEKAQRMLRIDPVRIAAVGLLIAVGTALIPLFVGDAFLRQYNVHLHDVPMVGDLALGTPLLFDCGVFLVVVGVTTKMLFVLSRSIGGLPALPAEERAFYAAPLEHPIEPAGERRDDAKEGRS